VITTAEGAGRLGGNSSGLTDWQSSDLSMAAVKLRVIATPARHGPAGLNRGAVTGFVLFNVDSPERVIYISGDTVLRQSGLDEREQETGPGQIGLRGQGESPVAYPPGGYSHSTLSLKIPVSQAGPWRRPITPISVPAAVPNLVRLEAHRRTL
jgi:hypothetical protein